MAAEDRRSRNEQLHPPTSLSAPCFAGPTLPAEPPLPLCPEPETPPAPVVDGPAPPPPEASSTGGEASGTGGIGPASSGRVASTRAASASGGAFASTTPASAAPGRDFANIQSMKPG